MAPCFLCNDLKDGTERCFSIEEWIANVLDSVCPYCQLLMEAAKELDLAFLSPESSAHAKPGTELELQMFDPRKFYVNSYWQGQCRGEDALKFFRSAQDVAADGMFPVRGEIVAVPGDADMWQFLRSCLNTCLAEHSGCAQEQNRGWFPERVVSIQRGLEGDPLLRLVETRQQLTRSAYIAFLLLGF
jgi:hypothetical protein